MNVSDLNLVAEMLVLDAPDVYSFYFTTATKNKYSVCYLLN
jgi:hypothetical protein